MWPQMILPPNPIPKNSLHFSNISKRDSASVVPLHKHNSIHQDDGATILNEQFQPQLPLAHETTRKY